MTSQMVTLAPDGPAGVWSVTLNRPEKKNALSQAMWSAIADAFEELAHRPGVRVVLLRGTSDVFCAGADISEFAPLSDDLAAADVFTGLTQRAQQAVADFPAPTIAVIRGACIGGGCGLALACDYRLGDHSAKMGITPARLGLSYTLADTARVVAAVGPDVAKDILFTGRIRDAQASRAAGLLTGLFEPTHLDDAVQTLIAELLSVSSTTAKTVKAFIAQINAGQIADSLTDREIYLNAFAGRDFREGYQAFLEKRRPDFSAQD